MITDASSETGANVVICFANLGTIVSMVGKTADKLNNVDEQITNACSPTPLVIVANVTKNAERIANEKIIQFGQLDISVNNAGFGITVSTMRSIFLNLIAFSIKLFEVSSN